MPYRTRSYQFHTRATTAVMAGSGVMLGALMIYGGPERFSAHGFDVARTLAGGVYSWAAIVLACGIVTLTGIFRNWHRLIVMAGMAGMAAWFGFFALVLGIAAVQDPRVAVTGPVIYTAAMVVCLLCWEAGHLLAPGGTHIEPVDG